MLVKTGTSWIWLHWDTQDKSDRLIQSKLELDEKRMNWKTKLWCHWLMKTVSLKCFTHCDSQTDGRIDWWVIFCSAMQSANILGENDDDCSEWWIVVVVDWRDFEEMSSRHDGKQQLLDELMETWSNTTGGSTSSSSYNLKSMYHEHFVIYSECYCTKLNCLTAKLTLLCVIVCNFSCWQ